MILKIDSYLIIELEGEFIFGPHRRPEGHEGLGGVDAWKAKKMGFPMTQNLSRVKKELSK
jgi:hypothetical protein